ncbi:MAG TPA: hypothetical protein VFP61_00310 [Acidimicrobiales bacterium]|nr:hypothetical protein [Acidimicrobiales bacterium]
MPRLRRTIRFVAPAAAAVSLVVAGPALAAPGHVTTRHTAKAPKTGGSPATSFVGGVLPPPPPGSTAQYNIAGEPQIRADGAGNDVITSEDGLGAGTDAWRSTDGGLSYTSLPQPNAVSSASAGTTGLAPGGGDTDVATAPVKNANGFYNIYVASLTLGNITLSVSTDGGASWTDNPVAATVPGDDREWIAPIGADGYVLSYHAISTDDQIIVNEGVVQDGDAVTVMTYDAFDPSTAAAGTNDNELGNIAVDQLTGDVYQVFAACPSALTAQATCAGNSSAYMAVGTPTGTVPGTDLPLFSFADHDVYDGPATATLDNNFPNVAVDRAGNVYAAWSDDHDVSVAYSTDHGATWSSPKKVNSGAAVTAIFPWMTALAPGKVDIAYYATPAPENDQTCATSSASDPCQTEPWYVYMAQDVTTTAGGGWSQVQVTPAAVHLGGVCQGGISCTATGNDNRDLYDDFGIAASPTTGLASIAYTDDQYAQNVGTANAGECTAAQTDSVSCDHTSFATQTAGTAIN